MYYLRTALHLPDLAMCLKCISIISLSTHSIPLLCTIGMVYMPTTSCLSLLRVDVSNDSSSLSWVKLILMLCPRKSRIWICLGWNWLGANWIWNATFQHVVCNSSCVNLREVCSVLITMLHNNNNNNNKK